LREERSRPWGLDHPGQAADVPLVGAHQAQEALPQGTPKGYDSSVEIRNVEKLQSAPPSFIRYSEKQVFELRCHMYQARSLIGSDSSGLSDPFARVLFSDQSQTTQVIDETLSPTWDEMLFFNDVVVYGNQEDIREDPPGDRCGDLRPGQSGQIRIHRAHHSQTSREIFGRALLQAEFPPSLEWYDIFRGSEQAGELLATFELYNYPNRTRRARYQICLSPKKMSGDPTGAPFCPFLQP
ncbi:otoferlin, partial [Caerostris extrusa]